MIVDMKNISCIRGDRKILSNINWTVKSGEHWAMIGMNGSGKTTLLNVISGYIFPSSGEMTVLGKSFGAYDWRRLRREMGFISSSLHERFYAGETAIEIVLGGLYASLGLYDKPKKREREKAKWLLDQLQCSHGKTQGFGELSQGERQKVLIARALISEPRLLIMDEPCASLDIFSREHLLSSIETLARQKTSPVIIYVTHHVEEIMPVFTHALLLRRGRVFSAGKTRQVLRKSNLSAFFETSVDVRWKNQRPWITIQCKSQKFRSQKTGTGALG